MNLTLEGSSLIYPIEYKWTHADTVETTINITAVRVSNLIDQSTIKLPEVIQKFDTTLDYQSNKDQKKFTKTIIVLTFLYLSTITYLILK